MSVSSNKEIRKTAIFTARMLEIAILVVAAICNTGCFGSDTSLYQEAIELQNAGNPEKAIAKLSRIKESSELYEQAQFNLYLDYLELQDSLAAGNALVNAVRKGDWNENVYDAYECYADCLLNGTMAPYIHTDTDGWTIAQLLEASPNNEYRNFAGEIYFYLSQYDKAYEILLPNTSWSDRANGYVGMMYLHGLAGLKCDAETAYKYLMQAPDENPFLVEKGDLVLFLKKGDTKYFESSIGKACPYYKMAASQDPGNKAYADRYEITRQILDAQKWHDNNFFNSSRGLWRDYSFSNGSYRGELGVNTKNMTYEPHGWGCIVFDNGEINMGKFVRCTNSGLCLIIAPTQSGGYSVFVGEYRNSCPVRGSYIFENGNAWRGTFRQTTDVYELTDGVEVNLNDVVLREFGSSQQPATGQNEIVVDSLPM